MDELLKKLFESELLNDDSKKELTEAFEAKITEAVEAAKAETEVKVRAELTEQFIVEKDAIIEALDTKAEEFLNKHMKELNESVADFRDLEAEYAARLVEERKNISEAVKSDMATLIDQLDAFNTQCLEEEFAEFEESINEVKKLQFGAKIYEAFAKTYDSNFADSNDTLNKLKEAEVKLAETEKSLNESVKALKSVKRDQKMTEVLEPLSGLPREVMETILKSTPTEKLEEAYDKFIGRVLNDVSKSEKESVVTPVLAESEKIDAVKEDVTVVTGDVTPITESKQETKTKLSEATSARLKKLAGVEE